MMFADRFGAGRELARRLGSNADDGGVIVLGLARGGVPVAAEVARALGAPLDVLVVRKLGVPWQPELGFGAISEGGVELVDDDLVSRLGLTSEEIDQVVQTERVELERRLQRYRGNEDAIRVDGRTAIVVDDGIATGSTARAAIESVRRRGATRIVLATPVAAPASLVRLRGWCDEIVCLHHPRSFRAVGEFYEDFSATTDDEVRDALGSHDADGPNGTD